MEYGMEFLVSSESIRRRNTRMDDFRQTTLLSVYKCLNPLKLE